MSTVRNVFPLWKQVHQQLRSQIDSYHAQELERKVISCEHEGSTIRLGVPNGFALEWVEKKYRSLIAQQFQEQLGQPIELSVSITQPQTSPEPYPQDSLFAAAVLEDSANLKPTDNTNNRYIAPLQPAVDSILPHPQQKKAITHTAVLSRSNAHPHVVLNRKFTFDNFVVGNHNRLAHAAGLAVADMPGHAYNPLFIYGGVGLGKTHLMHSIANAVLTQHPEMRVMYVSSEVFTNELIQAIRENATDRFRKRYRPNDILLIDDVQFIIGKESTQNEFFHTFNTLHEAGKQVVISSDRPPYEFQTLEPRLRSRFAAGLIADIQCPDFETRMAILQSKLAQLHVQIPEEVLTTIALRIDSNVRELEGALIRVYTQSRIKGLPLDADFAAMELDETYESQPSITPSHSNSSFQKILNEVARFYQLDSSSIVGKSRKQQVLMARQLAMYLMREHTGASFAQIGQEFGGKDHTTVMHAVEKIQQLVQFQPELQQATQQIAGRIFR